MLCRATEKPVNAPTCATDHALETSCPHAHKVTLHGSSAGLHDRRPARPDRSHEVHGLPHIGDCFRRGTPVDEWTMDRVMAEGFEQLPRFARAVYGRFLAPQLTPVEGYQKNAEAQYRRNPASDPFQSLSILQAQRAETRVCRRRASQAGLMRATIFGTPDLVLPFTSATPDCQEFADLPLRDATAGTKRRRATGHRCPYSLAHRLKEEASAFYATGTAQYHINADIMYALRASTCRRQATASADCGAGCS